MLRWPGGIEPAPARDELVSFTDVFATLLDYAYDTLALHRVFAITDVLNAPSIRLLERLGFRREGHFRKNYWSGTEWTSEYLYAQLEEEWQ